MRYFSLTPSVLASVLFIISISPAYGQYGHDVGDEIMDQITEGVETGITSIEVPNNNLIDTDQEEVDSLAHSFSEWLDSLFGFGKSTHALTEDAMAVAAPSWVDEIIISVVAGAVVIFIMWKVIKKVGIHIAIGMGALATVIVFLMLLDLNS